MRLLNLVFSQLKIGESRMQSINLQMNGFSGRLQLRLLWLESLIFKYCDGNRNKIRWLKVHITISNPQSGPGIIFCYNSKAHSIGDHLWLLCVTWNLRRVRKSTLSEPILESRKPALGPGWIVVDHHTGHLLPISRQTRRGWTYSPGLSTRWNLRVAFPWRDGKG